MRDLLKKHQNWALPAIFILAFFCTGIFHEYLSCAFSVLITIYLYGKIKKEKQLVLYKNATSLFVFVLILFYLLSILWSVDYGMALIGVFKFLPIGIFLIVLMQGTERERLLKLLPYVAVVITIVSMIGMLIPALQPYFTVAGRLAGTFQYPNTYALFLLVCELLLLAEKKRLKEYIMLVVILGGLLLTGSRTVFVLALLANLLFVLLHKNKKVRIAGIGVIALVVVGVILYAILSGGTDAITRLLRISLTESTFVGRFLYFADALPVILKHPFGLGYMGHYYIQQSIQTGLYSVKFIHNDFLQIMLDVGWLPCILFLIAIVKTLMNRKIAFERKLILIVMCLHSCFDFNLQFGAMFCLIFLFMDYDSGKKVVLKKQLRAIKGIAIAAASICLYLGIALVFEYAGNYEAALKLYPWNTQAATAYLTEIEKIDVAGEVADKILERNTYVTLAESVKARQAYASGDFGSLIAYKNDLIQKAPYQYEEYEEYCRMLINGMTLYNKSGDTESAEICKQELISIPKKLKQAEDKLSKLGKMIKDQPVTELPEDLTKYIERLEDTQ